jgi:3-ketosteroid 9alpha-monooxygenase subunit A
MSALQAKRFPQADYPSSWYAVAWSSDVMRGKAAPIRAFGQDLVAFRTSDGKVQVLDAICPHLGAHLGHGGTVVDDQLRCPFHGWQFDATGACALAPSAKLLPKAQPLQCWHAGELHGRIWLWFDPTGASPSWPLPTTLLDPVKTWRYAGQLNRQFASHPQDIMENAVDADHFLFIHGMSEILHAETAYEDNGLHTRLLARSRSERLGFPGFVFELEIIDRVYGMGMQTITTHIHHPKLGLRLSTIVVEGLVPREPGQIDLLIDIYMTPLPIPGFQWLAHRSFYKAVASDVDDDIAVWAHRRHLARPLLTSADTQIGAYRRWAKRFYAPAVSGVPSADAA